MILIDNVVGFVFPVSSTGAYYYRMCVVSAICKYLFFSVNQTVKRGLSQKVE